MSAAILLLALWADVPTAETHFNQAESYYQSGEFDRALESYWKSYALLPEPAFLFNIGQCHRNLGQYERALFFFRSYLRDAKDPVHRDAVEGVIATLESMPRAETSTPTAVALAVVTPAPPLVEDDALYETWWFWTLIGAGVAAAATGTALAVTSRDDLLDDVPSGATIIRVP